MFKENGGNCNAFLDQGNVSTYEAAIHCISLLLLDKYPIKNCPIC